jgi:hypothetical protein
MGICCPRRWGKTSEAYETRCPADREQSRPKYPRHSCYAGLSSIRPGWGNLLSHREFVTIFPLTIARTPASPLPSYLSCSEIATSDIAKPFCHTYRLPWGGNTGAISPSLLRLNLPAKSGHHHQQASPESGAKERPHHFLLFFSGGSLQGGPCVRSIMTYGQKNGNCINP